METTVPPGKGKKKKRLYFKQTDRQADRWVDRVVLEEQT